MAEIVTYAEAVAALKDWTAALAAAQTGKSYSIAGRTLTRQDIGDIRAEIQRWHNTVTALEARQKGQTRRLGAVAEFPAPGRLSGSLYAQDLWERW